MRVVEAEGRGSEPGVRQRRCRIKTRECGDGDSEYYAEDLEAGHRGPELVVCVSLEARTWDARRISH